MAALWASESIIYGRFGYGPGTFHETWSIDRQHAAYAKPFERRGQMRFIDPDDVGTIYPEVYRRATAGRPGTIRPPDTKWERITADLADRRGVANAYFRLVFEEEGQVDGYVYYRIKDGTVQIGELMAATPESHRALWRYCLDIDLMASTSARARPQDDPLPWILADPRRLSRETSDALWIRLVDVAKALTGRRYALDASLVFGVKDSFCSWNDGTYELDGGPDGADCRRSIKRPDIVLPASGLAATYLGAVSFTTLAQAGRVAEHTPGALERADKMFATNIAPWCTYDF
jgi:predicted acetyltransferase